jgi:hypothetical protein
MESSDTPDAPDTPPFTDISERRHRIFERTKARYVASGMALDDPEYLDLIARWIDVEITMPEAAAQWDEIRKLRRKRRMKFSPRLNDINLEGLSKLSHEELLAEIAEIERAHP